MHIELTTTPRPEDAATISRGIVDFNRRTIPGLERIEDEVKFFIFARHADGEVVGGIRAHCFWNTLHIELLWLDEACRGTGSGRTMIEMAERFGVENDCEHACVETTSWQARGFYEKCGYTVFGTFEGRPRGQVSYHLKKRIATLS